MLNITDLTKLPNLDSNQDTQIQNLTYYLYTIGQWDRKIRVFSPNFAKIW
jgi:hypothetical protein